MGIMLKHSGRESFKQKKKKQVYLKSSSNKNCLRFPTAFHKLCSGPLAFNLSSKHILFFSYPAVERKKITVVHLAGL